MGATATVARDKVREIIDLARALALAEQMSRPDAAWRILDGEFPGLPDAVRSLAHYGLVQQLGVDNHIRNQKAATLPASNEPGGHLKLVEGTTMRAGFRAFMDDYRFVGAGGIEVDLGDARYGDLDLRGSTEGAQGRARMKLEQAFFALRDAIGKKRSVRELSERVARPLVEALQEAIATAE